MLFVLLLQMKTIVLCYLKKGVPERSMKSESVWQSNALEWRVGVNWFWSTSPAVDFTINHRLRRTWQHGNITQRSNVRYIGHSNVRNTGHSNVLPPHSGLNHNHRHIGSCLCLNLVSTHFTIQNCHSEIWIRWQFRVCQKSNEHDQYWGKEQNPSSRPLLLCFNLVSTHLAILQRIVTPCWWSWKMRTWWPE